MDHPATRRCKAHSSRTGKPCKRPPSIGREVCATHGAKGGRPIIHGRYSERLPDRISKPYLASLSDPSLFDLTQTIAALDALVKVQAARVEEGDTPLFRSTVLKLWHAYSQAINGGDENEAASALNALQRVLEDGDAVTKAEQDLVLRLEALSKRIEEAWKIRLAQRNSVNGKDLGELFVSILGIIRDNAPREIADRIVDAISGAMDRLGMIASVESTLIASRTS
jgi:hypothetical protein